MNRLKYLIATLGGFQFGYTVGIMSGAILFLTTQFNLSPDQQGGLVSAFLFGSLPGSIIAGPLVNWLGRKKLQQAAALVFLLGTLMLVYASSVTEIFTGRVIEGLAVGIFAVVGPMYLAEISPAEKRGFYIGCYQLAVTLGIFVAYGINYLFSASGDWKWMFGLGMIPAIFQFIGFFSLPESTPPAHVEKHKFSWSTFLEPQMRYALIVVILINVFQQITGINAILYFAPTIFQSAGFASPQTAILATNAMGIINFVMTIVSMFLVDKWGRRPLLITGIIGVIIGLAGLSTAFLLEGSAAKGLATASMLTFTAAFAIGLGPLPQLLAPEMFKRSVRGIGISIGGLSNWISNILVVYTFMDLTSRISHAGTFAVYGFLGLIALFFVWKYVPETKGKAID